MSKCRFCGEPTFDYDDECKVCLEKRVRRDAIDKERQRIMVIIDERGLLDHLDFDIAEEIKKELLVVDE